MDEVFASPEGAALVDIVEDPDRDGALRMVRDPLRFDGQPLGRATAAAHARRTHRRGPGRMNAAERWRRRSTARAIPQPLIDAAPASPWGFPREVFEARARTRHRRSDRGRRPRPIGRWRPCPDGIGTVLDVGVGGGATSLPLARRAGTIIGVRCSRRTCSRRSSTTGGGAGVAAGRGARADGPTIEAGAPRGRRRDVRSHDLQRARPRSRSSRHCDGHARQRVVLEATDRHPLGWMADLWRTFHDLDIPDEPRDRAGDRGHARRSGSTRIAEDRPGRDDDPGGGGFTTREAAVALVRTRLCLTPR